jgi:hypothetical protein
MRPINIANLDPLDNSKWKVAEGPIEVLNVFRY